MNVVKTYMIEFPMGFIFKLCYIVFFHQLFVYLSYKYDTMKYLRGVNLCDPSQKDKSKAFQLDQGLSESQHLPKEYC